MSGAFRTLSVMLLLWPACAQAAPPDLCQSAILLAERAAPVPPALLSAIARVESGRALPGGRVVAWPWTINVAGTGHFYETQEQAIQAVQQFQAAGVQSIDVGCLQVNLMHHPNAFGSLQQAFDPAANAGYAARFLTALHRETKDWPAAIGAYHSRTPALADEYGSRVLHAWPGAAQYAPAPTPPIPSVNVDPYHVYTPEFARLVTQDKLARAQRDAAMAPPIEARSKLPGPLLHSPTPLHAATPPRGVRYAQLP